ncbi:DNA polymerase [Scheffersomyces amazonensis]|uniref:DNA polymerase n=1 Tax=Scheffersomyces amazonensis TaxID=1078765 RepID=UPI00315DD9A4
MAISKDHYYRLGSEVAQERIEAATSLVSELSELGTKDDWQYALNRLIKGLITSRQSARFGFSMALTEILSELIQRKGDYEDITVEYYLNLLLNTTQIASSMKGKEERSVLFGRLFGLQVLINTKVLFNSSICDEEPILKFINYIIELSNLKSWLRETTIFTLLQFIRVFLSDETNQSKELKEKVIMTVLQLTNDQGLNLSSEGVAIYLTIPKLKRSKLAANIVNEKANWKNGDPFTKGNLPLLSKALKDVEVADPEGNETNKGGKNPKQKGSWSPRIPFVWDLILQEFNSIDEDIEEVSNENSKKRKKSSSKDSKRKQHKSVIDSNNISIHEFWKVVIDDSFYSEKSSHERKYWGFEIFSKFIKELNNPDSIQYLFTPNFMRCLVNQSAQSNRLLHKISSKALKTITDEAQAHPEKLNIIFKSLINENNGGTWNFDLITRSKTIDTLLSIKANNQVLLQLKDDLIQTLNEAVENQEEIDNNTFKKSNDNKIKWCLDKLIVVVRRNLVNLSTIEDNKVIEDIIKLLVKQTFFESSGKQQLSTHIKNICQEKLNSILAEVINLKRSDNTWAYFTLKYLLKLEESSKFKNLTEFDEEILVVKQETTDVLKTIVELYSATKVESKIDQLRCFELLYSMVLLQLYLGEDEAVQIIAELNMCYENTFSNEIDDNVDTSVVLTEIILSFISKQSNLLKKLAHTVWEFFICSEDASGKLRLNEGSLQLLFDVLCSKENKEGQQKLFEGEDEMEIVEDDDEEGKMEEEGKDDDDEEDDDDDEEEDEEEEEEEEEEDEDEGEPDSDEIESEYESANDGADVDNKDRITQLDRDTNIKLAKALGIPTGDSGEVKFDELDSSDDEEYESDSMDDDQMIAMDKQLSEIFRERQSVLANISSGNKRKAEVVQAKQTMVLFKNNILDLIEIFNKVKPNSIFNLYCVKPLITLINLTLNKELGVKAHKILKTKLNKTKITEEELTKAFSSNEEIEEFKVSLLNIITELQDNLNSKKSSNQSHLLACNQSCIIIAKNLILVDSSLVEQIIDIYSLSLKKWALNSKSNITPSLFFDFINWLNSKR